MLNYKKNLTILGEGVWNRFFVTVLAILLIAFTFTVHAAISGIGSQHYVDEYVSFGYQKTVSTALSEWYSCAVKYRRHYVAGETQSNDNNMLITAGEKNYLKGGSTYAYSGVFRVTESMLSGQDSKTGEFQASLYCRNADKTTAWESPLEKIAWTAKKSCISSDPSVNIESVRGNENGISLDVKVFNGLCSNYNPSIKIYINGSVGIYSNMDTIISKSYGYYNNLEVTTKLEGGKNHNVKVCTDDYGCDTDSVYIEKTAVCGDFVCSAGEYCSDTRDVASCTDNMCYEPVCSNGCSQVLVANGQEDEKCSGNYHCDGSGNCVLDNYCGDGVCNNGEVPYTCTQDCGKCMTNSDCNDSNPSTEDVCIHQASPTSECRNTPYCGNGVCSADETCSTCSSDCGICPEGTVVTDVKETTAFGTDSWGVYGQDNYLYQVFTTNQAYNIEDIRVRVFDVGNPSDALSVELLDSSNTILATGYIQSSQTNTRSNNNYPYRWVSSNIKIQNLQPGKYTVRVKCPSCPSSSSQYAVNYISSPYSSSDYGVLCSSASCSLSGNNIDAGIVVYGTVPSAQSCQILSASWDKSSAKDNDTVQMSAATNGYCSGNSIKFDIWEDDGIFPHDFIETKIPSSASSYQFYDNFDDNDLGDWNTDPKPCTTCEKPVISGGIISGKYSGYYGVDPYTNWMIKPISADDSFTLELRAASGPQQPNTVHIHLLAPSYTGGTTKGYDFMVYGENAKRLELWRDSTRLGTYNVGSAIHDFHDYKLSRDSAGNWRLWIDGVEKQHSFAADATYTSFGFLAVNLHRDQSKLDWIRLSGGAASSDSDNDGYKSDADCNDNDASVNPGASDSTCNGIDNNCNGIADDQYLKRSCGTGACSGQTSCTSGAEVCSGPAPSQEVCDNIDNDCDGYTDEFLVRQCGTTDVGVCQYGNQACTSGMWGACGGNIEPTAETCNSLDDDCNGQTDENACAVEKYLWNADYNSDKIYKISTQGIVIKSFAAPYGYTVGVAFDGTNLWVSDSVKDRIYKMDIDGRVLASFSAPNTNIRDLSYDGTYLWTIDSSAKKIYKLTTTGSIISTITAPDYISRGIAYDSGYLWITGDYSNKIYKTTLTGTVVSSFASPSTVPTGIAVEGDYLWIADSGVDKIFKVTKSGTILSSFKSPYTYPTGLAIE